MKRILLAEDEEVLRMLIVDTLEDENYLIDEAADGQEALVLLAKNEYDLVILDYMMPVFSGYEVIEKVRENPNNKGLKILMLSAKSQQSEQEAVFAVGANSFMAKPFSPNQLLEKVKEMLNEN